MTETIVTNIECARPFLPAEAGLRAHVVRVAALAGRAAKTSGSAPALVETVELAALLHHYQPDPEMDGIAKLLGDLGMEVPPRLRPLPARAREAWEILSGPHDSTNDLLKFVESANLFDEQIENLPYEDLSTSDAIQDLCRSGMLTAEFQRALESFRVVTGGKLLDSLKSLPVDIQTRRWFPAKSYEALFAHSMEVAESASVFARRSKLVNEADAYLAGVFHDIGRVAFQISSVKKHLQDWETLGFPATYAEFLVSGTDHAALGAQQLRAWDFPKHIIDAVEYHHRIELTSSCLAAVVYATEDENESLPSCARYNIAAQRVSVAELRYGKAAG